MTSHQTTRAAILLKTHCAEDIKPRYVSCNLYKFDDMHEQAAWATADAPLESPCPAFSRLITTRDTGFKGRRLSRR